MRRTRPIVAGLGGILGVLLLVVVGNSLQWIGTTFPGFLLMSNRVIASAALSEWLPVEQGTLFQHQIVAVDGQPVDDAGAIYDAVRAQPVGSEHTYELRAPDGGRRSVRLPSRVFSRWDHFRLFGTYLLAGMAFIATGLVVFALMPDRAAGQALLSCGLAVGLFALTGVDLYGPHWFFRLHVLAETLAPVGLIHLALVFPTERLPRHRRTVLTVLYAASAVFALAYELQLYSPTAYTRFHLGAEAGQGASAAYLIGSAMWGFVRSTSPLVRRRIGVVALGTVAGFLVPGVLIGASALVGGSVPINFSAFTVFLFPLSVGYAALKRDLFQIDEVIRQAITYGLVFLGLGGAYLCVMLLIGMLVPNQELLLASPVVFAALNMGMVVAVVPVRARVQTAVDRSFFRQSYDGQEELSRLSGSLATVQGIDGIVSEVERVLERTLSPVRTGVVLRDEDGVLRRHLADGSRSDAPPLPAGLAERLASGEALARYEWDDGSGRELPAVWEGLQAELLVPILDGRGLVGLLNLGGRRSGRTFTMRDVAFLRAMANQVTLAVEEARLVRQLERKQASLIRADRLATLGRLSSGMAHELNNPLGAVLNSLRVLQELGREYASSIDDPNVQPEDHRAIAGEILDNAVKASEWAAKARDFVKGMTRQARDSRSVPSQEFGVREVIDHVRSLMAHRLASASCEVTIEEDAPGLAAFGDPGPLSQVLVNLITNALDAYDDAGSATPRRLLIRAGWAGDMLALSVRDWAGGIPADVLPRIFDELYTTKDVGRGTGLGLWISRNLIEETFAGTLTAATRAGEGTTFTATMRPGPGAACDTREPLLVAV